MTVHMGKWEGAAATRAIHESNVMEVAPELLLIGSQLHYGSWIIGAEKIQISAACSPAFPM